MAFDAAGGEHVGMENPDRPVAPVLIGDAERDHYTSLLSEHFAAGRLPDAEFQHRMARALSARSSLDLAELVADLPRPAPTHQPLTRSTSAWTGGEALLAILVVGSFIGGAGLLMLMLLAGSSGYFLGGALLSVLVGTAVGGSVHLAHRRTRAVRWVPVAPASQYPVDPRYYR